MLKTANINAATAEGEKIEIQFATEYNERDKNMSAPAKQARDRGQILDELMPNGDPNPIMLWGSDY